MDLGAEALERTRDVIYPSRYGAWDEAITLATPADVEGQNFDVVIVGTPPSTHLAVATNEIVKTKPRLLLIEKPLAHPDSDALRAFVNTVNASPTKVLVGYNQRLKDNTLAFLEAAYSLELGALKSLQSHMLESWDGILKAHFWMKSEKDSYLAFTDQGGGALLEHSHALNLLLYLAHELGQGKPINVEANIDWVSHESGKYDRDSQLRITMESGLVGEVRQDLHTWPAKKEARADFEKGSLLWTMGDSSDAVQHLSLEGTVVKEWHFPKTRPDDFKGEIAHLEHLLADPNLASPLDLSAGLEVMSVALAAFASSKSAGPVSLVELA